MKFVNETSRIVVSLERNDRMMESLMTVARELDVPSGAVTGIGALTDVTLAYYDLDRKEFLKQEFSDRYELISCVGNIAVKDGEKFVHAHITLSDRDFKVYGGHLFEANVSGAGEFVIYPFSHEIQRKQDEVTGLFLMDLANCELAGKRSASREGAGE